MSNCIVVKSDPNTNWVLYRNKEIEHYYYIDNPNILCLGPTLNLSDISKDFSVCHSIACLMFDAFISQTKKG